MQAFHEGRSTVALRFSCRSFTTTAGAGVRRLPGESFFSRLGTATDPRAWCLAESIRLFCGRRPGFIVIVVRCKAAPLEGMGAMATAEPCDEHSFDGALVTLRS